MIRSIRETMPSSHFPMLQSPFDPNVIGEWRDRESLDRFEHDAPVRPIAPGLGVPDLSVEGNYEDIIWNTIPVGAHHVFSRYLIREPKPWTWPWIKREINRQLCRWFGHAPWEVKRCGCGEDGEDGMGRKCPRCGEWE